MSLFANQLDASAAGRGLGLHDVQVFESLHFSVVAPPFVIFWENVSFGADVVVLAMRSLHSENISPKVVFSS